MVYVWDGRILLYELCMSYVLRDGKLWTAPVLFERWTITSLILINTKRSNVVLKVKKKNFSKRLWEKTKCGWPACSSFLRMFSGLFFKEGRYELTYFHTMTPFDASGKEAFENTVGKGEIACKSNFSFSHNVFYSIKDRNYHFCYI